MFPTSTDVTLNNETKSSSRVKSYLFDFDIGDFIVRDGKLVECDDIDAIKVWIKKILRKEKGRYTIYSDTEYGCHLEDLIIGNSYTVEFIEAELKREIEDALKQNSQIKSVTNFQIICSKHSITVTLEVVLSDEGRDTVTVTVGYFRGVRQRCRLIFL